MGCRCTCIASERSVSLFEWIDVSKSHHLLILVSVSRVNPSEAVAASVRPRS